MVLRATEPLRVCDIKPLGEGLEACVVNAGEVDAAAVDVVEIAPDGRRAALDEPLAAHAGKRVQLTSFGSPPEELGLTLRH
jgi:hypothetical protein